MKFVVNRRIELILFIVLIAAYFILRLPNLTLQPIFADEAIYIRWAQVMRAEPTLRFLPLSDGKTPLFMWAMIPVFKIISDPFFAGRFLSVVSGFFTLLGVFFLSKKVFNLRVALWTSFFYVITPYTIFFDRMALVDSMLSAFTIWSLYFAIWIIKKPRLDLTMILGYLLGGAILTKTSAMVHLLILPVALLGLKKNDQTTSHPYLRVLLFLAVAIFMALLIYNLLRLGPNFQQLSIRNADYVFSPHELKGRPLDPFIPHFRDIADWFPRLFTVPILILVLVGVYLVVLSFNRFGITILLWSLIPLLLEMAFLKTFTARYLLPSIAPMIIFAGVGLTNLLEKVKLVNFLKITLTLIVVLPMALRFDYQLIKNPPPDNLPKAERRGYFEDWTAGYGFKQIADYLLEQNKDKKVVVGTEGFFGTLPDGLYIYLDKANVSIVGSTATISAQIRHAAKDHPTFFVGNKKNLEGSVRRVKLILEYPKSKSAENELPDATVLYQVLPE